MVLRQTELPCGNWFNSLWTFREKKCCQIKAIFCKDHLVSLFDMFINMWWVNILKITWVCFLWCFYGIFVFMVESSRLHITWTKWCTWYTLMLCNLVFSHISMFGINHENGNKVPSHKIKTFITLFYKLCSFLRKSFSLIN